MAKISKHISIVLFLFVLLGCNFESSKPIVARKETMEAIIGKWQHVDLKKSDVKNIVFTQKVDKAGAYTCIITFSKKDLNGKLSHIQSWRYAGIGKIEILDIDCEECTLPVYFINSQTFDLNQNDIYRKDK